MPRNRWWWQFCILLIVYGIGTELVWTYEQIEETSTGLSEGEWVAGVLGSFVVINGALYWHARRAEKGTVTASRLERENGSAIPLADVEKIVREGGGFPAVVFIAGNRVKVHLQDSELSKLAQTRLNKWMIDDDELTAEPGESGQELQISYAPVGMYNNLFEIGRWMLVFSITVKAFSGAFWVAKLLFRASLCILSASLLICLPFYFLRVKVSVAGDIVTAKRGKKEDSFRISDVTNLERGLFQVKVTTKNGEVFRFPQACLLLPEIIEEYGNSMVAGQK